MSLQEYLKRYSSDSKTKKKKKVELSGGNRLKLIDEDVCVLPANSAPIEHEEFSEDEDQPVLTFYQNKTDELRMLGKFSLSSWKQVSDSDEDDQPQVVTSDVPFQGVSPEDQKTLSEPQRSKNVPSPSGRRQKDETNKGSLSKQKKKSDDANNKNEVPLSSVRSSHPSPKRRRESVSHDRQDVSHRKDRRERKTEKSSSPSERSRRSEHSFSSPKKELSSEFTRQSSVASSSVYAASRSRTELSEDLCGRYADPVVRKRQLIKRGQKEETEEQKQVRKELENRFAVWGKGAKQVKEREEKLEEFAKEVAKPLARYEGDEDLEKHLKSQLHEDDPMFEYIAKKRSKDNVELAERQRRRLGPPNRFKIPPGVRWDGVDRSNGFEDRLLSQKNLRSAEMEEYYKWAAGSYE